MKWFRRHYNGKLENIFHKNATQRPDVDDLVQLVEDTIINYEKQKRKEIAATVNALEVRSKIQGFRTLIQAQGSRADFTLFQLIQNYYIYDETYNDFLESKVRNETIEDVRANVKVFNQIINTRLFPRLLHQDDIATRAATTTMVVKIYQTMVEALEEFISQIDSNDGIVDLAVYVSLVKRIKRFQRTSAYTFCKAIDMQNHAEEQTQFKDLEQRYETAHSLLKAQIQQQTTGIVARNDKAQAGGADEAKEAGGNDEAKEAGGDDERKEAV